MSLENTQSVEDRIADKLFGAEEEPQETTEEPTTDQAEDQADEGETPEPQSNAVDEVEVEVEGWKGKIPVKLKAEIDKASDYTRKTQELAETRKTFEAQQRLSQEEQAFYQSVSKEVDELRQIDAQLEQYRRVDLSQIDQDALSRMSMIAANLREDRAKLKEGLDQKRGQFKQHAFQTWDEMTSRARDVMRKTNPDWDTVSPKLAEYAMEAGFPFEAITGYDRKTHERVGPGVVDPAFAATLLKAWRWDQLQTKKPAVSERTAKAPPILKPGTADTRGKDQVSLMNFRKAMKVPQSEAKRAQLIGERVAARLEKLGR